MSGQAELFYESMEEALKDDIRALGGSKVVGAMLWPEFEDEPEKTRTRLNDRVSAERRERLSDAQERLIMRKAREKRGWSAVMCFIADDTGFERPKALAPVDEAARLQRAFIESVHQQGEMLARMERIAGMASLPPSQLRRA